MMKSETFDNNRKDATSNASIAQEEQELLALPWMIRLTILTLILVVAGWATGTFTTLPVAVPWTLYGLAYLSGGYYSVQEAWESLQKKQFDINVLMIFAALGAAAIGQPGEGAVLMFLFSLSHTLETYAMGRTHDSISSLMKMTPTTARVLRSHGNEVIEEEVTVEHVSINDTVLVRPGEQIPTDGVVVRGESSVNEASITGESLPVEKQQASRVFAGTLNEQGMLEIRVTTRVEDSTLSRIVKVVSEARENKAQSQDFTDRVIGQYYAYGVVGMTLLAIIIPLAFLGWPLHDTLYRAMTLMVVASPCALVISIPAALLSGLASSARNGVLFKGGSHLEAASRVRAIAFDKTGTLTTGRPGVVHIISLEPIPSDIPCIYEQDKTQTNNNDNSGDNGEPPPLTQDQTRILAAAAAVERSSEHPLAQAIMRGAEERGIAVPQAEQFEALTGNGVRATVCGRQILVGRKSLFDTLSPEAEAIIAREEQQGHSVILVGDTHPWGIIAIADTVRPEAAPLVANLKQMGIEQVVLITGDNRYVAETLGRELGIDEVRYELLPEEKVVVVRELQERYGAVAMVGDGINDAPSLASATIGVAMGAAGTDVALESADVLLMKDDLSQIPRAFRLAHRARRVVRQNLGFAFAVILVLVAFTIAGGIPLTLGVIGHEGSTLIVVANGLRLLLPWR
jgi:Cd2+/Zn2+-exporting ATPase